MHVSHRSHNSVDALGLSNITGRFHVLPIVFAIAKGFQSSSFHPHYRQLKSPTIMEVVGITLAVASLTFQLIDGVERLGAFLEECKDPLIDIGDLAAQLYAVQSLLEIVQLEAARTGSGAELSVSDSARCLQDEVSRSVARLQDLTRLIADFKALPATAGAPPHEEREQGRGSRKLSWGSRRVGRYIVLYSQQKKLRRLTQKLDRMRITILDHFQLALFENMSSIRKDQSDLLAKAAMFHPGFRDGTQPGGEQGSIIQYRQSYKQEINTDDTTSYPDERYHNFNGRAPYTGKPDTPSAQASATLRFNQRGGTSTLYSHNQATINSSQSGSSFTMFKVKAKRRAARSHGQQKQPPPPPPTSTRAPICTEDSIDGNLVVVNIVDGEHKHLFKNGLTIQDHIGHGVMFEEEEEEAAEAEAESDAEEARLGSDENGNVDTVMAEV